MEKQTRFFQYMNFLTSAVKIQSSTLFTFGLDFEYNKLGMGEWQFST